MFGSGSTPAFGAGFGSSSTPVFGSNTASAFGASSSSPSLFGSSTQSGFGLPGSTPSPFGQSTPSQAFGQTQPSLFGQSTPQQQAFPFTQTPSFGQTQTSLFGGAQSSPFGQFQTPAFGGTQSSPFGQTPQSTPAFGQTQALQFGTPQQSLFSNSQLTTQMAPVAPVATPLPDRDIQAIVDAYKSEAGNPKYGFKHFLLSVTDPSMRIKPVGVSDIMWAEAMNKLEGMESADRERLWPELVQGFKDLSRRLKVMRIVEAVEGKGFRMLTTKGEAHLGERLRVLARQLQGPGAELPRRVNTLLSVSRMQAQVGGAPTLLPGLAKIDERSLGDMHEVLRQQTEAISRLVGILKKDMRDIEIIMSEDTETIDESVESNFRRSGRNGTLPMYDVNGLNGY